MEDLSQQLHVQVLEGHGSVHQLLLLQQQHEEPALHVPQQVPGAVGVHAVVTDDGALLQVQKQTVEVRDL